MGTIPLRWKPDENNVLSIDDEGIAEGYEIQVTFRHPRKDSDDIQSGWFLRKNIPADWPLDEREEQVKEATDALMRLMCQEFGVDAGLIHVVSSKKTEELRLMLKDMFLGEGKSPSDIEALAREELGIESVKGENP